MIYFLTSSPCCDDGSMNPQNGMAAELLKALNADCKALFIASSPDDISMTEKHAYDMKANYEKSGITLSEYILLDRRNQEQAENLVKNADFIILAGGHVPTQLNFFQEIRLRRLLKDFHGVLMGISAGTMNAADVVYVHPEREGETRFKDMQRYRQGLGLTKTMVIPHYQMIKDWMLDGLRLFEDVAYSDSAKSGYDFYCLPDGSYLYGHDGVEELRGEAYLIHDGQLTQVSHDGDILMTKGE
ncbi:MAG: dipeptidase E [Ruminococcaceae bacterium]|nr:dipeptidase E [Oscillospiraceae bacterium]